MFLFMPFICLCYLLHYVYSNHRYRQKAQRQLDLEEEEITIKHEQESTVSMAISSNRTTIRRRGIKKKAAIALQCKLNGKLLDNKRRQFGFIFGFSFLQIL